MDLFVFFNKAFKSKKGKEVFKDNFSNFSKKRYSKREKLDIQPHTQKLIEEYGYKIRFGQSLLEAGEHVLPGQINSLLKDKVKQREELELKKEFSVIKKLNSEISFLRELTLNKKEEEISTQDVKDLVRIFEKSQEAEVRKLKSSKSRVKELENKDFQLENFELNFGGMINEFLNTFMRRRVRVQKLDGAVENRKKISEKIKENFKYGLRWMMRNKYFSKDKDLALAQLDGLYVWVDYLSENYSRPSFIAFILMIIIRQESNWLEKTENGTWKSFERKQFSQNLFPNFDANVMPQIISELYYIYNNYIDVDKAGMSDALPEEYSEEVRRTIDTGDIRELFFLLRKNILEKRKILSESLEEEVQGEWQPVFSIKQCRTKSEKLAVALRLVKATTYTNSGLCIDKLSTALEYLERGDIHIYSVRFMLKSELKIGGEKISHIDVPKITVLVSGDKIDPKEFHGDAKNQGIETKYIGVAKEWLRASDFTNKDEFEIRFADVEISSRVEDKIKNIENGGQDLDQDELRFLYQIYRKAEFFELENSSKIKIDRLINERLNIRFLRKTNQSLMTYEQDPNPVIKELREKDYEDMFGCGLEEIVFSDKNWRGAEAHTKVIDKIKEGKVKVVFGMLNLIFSNLEDMNKVEEITGTLFLNSGDMKVKKNMLKSIKNLKRINGIKLTEEDKRAILSGDIDQFPDSKDPRLVGVYIEK